MDTARSPVAYDAVNRFMRFFACSEGIVEQVVLVALSSAAGVAALVVETTVELVVGTVVAFAGGGVTSV